MLSDIASECDAKETDTLASAVLSVALTWAYIGEEKRARSTYAEAAALNCTSKVFQNVLQRSAAIIGATQKSEQLVASPVVHSR
jgi:hypothetical protein